MTFGAYVIREPPPSVGNLFYELAKLRGNTVQHQWRKQKFFKGRRTMCQPLRHSWQMHIMKYTRFIRKKWLTEQKCWGQSGGTPSPLPPWIGHCSTSPPNSQNLKHFILPLEPTSQLTTVKARLASPNSSWLSRHVTTRYPAPAFWHREKSWRDVTCALVGPHGATRTGRHARHAA